MTNGLSHPYHLDESTFIFRGIRSDFSFLFHFSIKFMKANRIAPDGTPHFCASHLGLFCLPMSHKKDDRLIWVKEVSYYRVKMKVSNLFSGRSQLLPVVGHSVATSNVWRLNPNNLRFTLNGPLPYTKVM